MRKENNILKRVGTKNPFTVPKGYFENFTSDLMSKLPEKESSLPITELTLWERVKPWLYMTAMFCGIMLSVRLFVGIPQQDEFPFSELEADAIPNEEWEIISDLSMIDDYDLYEYLTEVDN